MDRTATLDSLMRQKSNLIVKIHYLHICLSTYHICYSLIHSPKKTEEAIKYSKNNKGTCSTMWTQMNKQPKWMDEWVNKLWYIHTIEYYLSVRKDDTDTWYDVLLLKTPLLSERSQTVESHIIWFHLLEISRISKSIETECRLVVARSWGVRKKEE